MDHKEFAASLPLSDKSELGKIDDHVSLVHLTIHLGAIVCMGALIAVQVPFWPILLPLQGVLIVFLFTVEHEATHNSVFSNPKINDAIGYLIGLMILLPFLWFRYFHLAHHRYTNIEGKDPELLTGERPQGWRAYIWHVSGIPYWVGMATTIVSNASGHPPESYMPKRAVSKVRTESRLMAIAYLLIALSLFVTPIVLWVWIIPVFIGQPFLRIFLLAEHGHCPKVANMFENTRTTFTNRCVRYLTWNASYHVEHHTFPTVPSQNLPRLHEKMRDQLQVTSEGYCEFAAEYPKRFERSP